MKATLFFFFSLFSVGKTFAQTADTVMLYQQWTFPHEYNYYSEAEFIKMQKIQDKKLNKHNIDKYYRLCLAFLERGKMEKSEKILYDIVAFAKTKNADAYEIDTTKAYEYSKKFGFEHEICLLLAERCVQQKRYTEALKYTQLADKRYLYGNTHCGTAIMDDADRVKNLYIAAYGDLKR